MEGLGGVELDAASDSAKKVKTTMSKGNEDRRQRSIASEKVTKRPMDY